MNARKRDSVALLFLLLIGSTVHATPDARGDAEIRHLLTFVAGSGCTFIRNGDVHDAPSAAEHLGMKYGKAKSRLSTPEQFIEHVASKSYFTGQPYRVRCANNISLTSEDWLRAELGKWRAQAAVASRDEASRRNQTAQAPSSGSASP